MKMFADRATELKAVAEVYRQDQPPSRARALKMTLASRLADRFNGQDGTQGEESDREH
jgi:hypothetical protein